MKVLLVCLAFAVIGAIDLPDMIRNKRLQDLTAYSIFFVLVLALGLLIAAGVKVPSPIKAIQAFYQNVLGLAFKPS